MINFLSVFDALESVCFEAKDKDRFRSTEIDLREMSQRHRTFRG
jgi:hypothetical protein